MTLESEAARAPAIDYGHIEMLPVYFEDLDPMGFVHNARYQNLLERALATFWDRRGMGAAGSDNGVYGHPDAFLAVAEYSIGYKAPIRGIGKVGVHIWLDRLGNTSATYGFRIVSADGAIVHAEGRRVHIRLDESTLRPAPWGPATRAVFESILRG